MHTYTSKCTHIHTYTFIQHINIYTHMQIQIVFYLIFILLDLDYKKNLLFWLKAFFCNDFFIVMHFLQVVVTWICNCYSSEGTFYPIHALELRRLRYPAFRIQGILQVTLHNKTHRGDLLRKRPDSVCDSQERSSKGLKMSQGLHTLSRWFEISRVTRDCTLL